MSNDFFSIFDSINDNDEIKFDNKVKAGKKIKETIILIEKDYSEDLREMINIISSVKTKENINLSTNHYKNIVNQNDNDKLNKEIIILQDLLYSTNKYKSDWNIDYLKEMNNTTIYDKLIKNKYIKNEKDLIQYIFINNINIHPIVRDKQNFYKSDDRFI